MKNSLKGVKSTVEQYKGVIGIDEVGRGPLAGPITVCGVYIKDKKAVKRELFKDNVRDSKKIKKSIRFNIYQIVRKNRKINKNIIYSITSRSAEFIDKYGIQLAARQCVDDCLHKLAKNGVKIDKVKINLDAGLRSSIEYIHQDSYIRGDEQFTEIALASILAKEYRDSYMNKLSKVHKEYKWENNVGYGTLDHRNAIKAYGISKYHRTTYLKGFKLFEKTK